MLNLTTPTRPVQRLARILLVGFCVVLAIGFSGAVVARLVQPEAPGVRFVDSVQLDDVQHDVGNAPAMSDLPAAPIKATELARAGKSSLLAASAPEVDSSASRVILMEVTAYCPCEKCCGTHSPGITASGKHVSYNQGRFVAADTRVLPFGTQLSIPGYHDGQPVPVLDRGGAIKGNKLDVYFPSHETALKWGRRKVAVTVVGG